VRTAFFRAACAVLDLACLRLATTGNDQEFPEQRDTDAGQILYTTAATARRVLLQVVPETGELGRNIVPLVSRTRATF